MMLLGSVDLGGTNIACAVGTADGVLVAERTIPTNAHDGPEHVLARVGDVFDGIGRPAAIGMGMPGLVDRASGVVRFLPNLPTNWRGVPAGEMLAGRVGCPVHLLNDVRLATLGELAFGHGRDSSTMLFFAIGTGIGGGVVIDGSLRLGPLGAAGEMGHQTVLPDGPPCGCGNRGCLEALASAPAIAAEGIRMMRIGMAPRLHEMTGGRADRVDPKTMSESGDEAVRAALVRAASWIGIGVANMVSALHPDLVVLGGGVAAIGPLLTETVEAAMRERVRMFPTDGVRVKRSALEDKAGLYGGIALAARQGKVD